MTNNIPGLVRIEEGTDNKFFFEIADDKVSEFYAHFGLDAGDTAGFQRIVEESLRTLLEIHKQDTVINDVPHDAPV